VLPQTLDVMDTTAEIRSVVGHLRAGERVEVLTRTAHWSELLLPRGASGWVESKYLLDAATYERGTALSRSLEAYTPQAAGHLLTGTSLHLEPTRDSIVLVDLAQNQHLEMFERRLVDRPADAHAPAATGKPGRDVWYLVRAGSRAGWLLGRFVTLDIPPGIATYAEGINMVGWVVLKTVDDGGNSIPEYLVADRIGGEADYNHIRIFTWWVKNHKYVTAYVESGLDGYFPIKVQEMRDTAYYAQPSPYFRLRLTDENGHRYQKIYGLFDTVAKNVGRVDGWESDAMPVPVSRKERLERQHQRHRTRR